MYTQRPLSAKTMRSKSALAILGSRNYYFIGSKPATFNELTLKTKNQLELSGQRTLFTPV